MKESSSKRFYLHTKASGPHEPLEAFGWPRSQRGVNTCLSTQDHLLESLVQQGISHNVVIPRAVQMWDEIVT